MRILGIETSCDETAASVVEDGRIVQSNVISSSQGEFTRTGGVIPEEAARRQLECILPVVDAALKESGCTIKDIDAIAVTHAPGLLGSLLVGTITARTLSWLHQKPLVPVHHTLGHLSSPWLDASDEPQFPILTLSASGGHTELWLRTSHLQGTLLGRTRDDAAGEAFDKGAQLLGLPYPGGPAISKMAQDGDHAAYAFPHPLKDEETFDWSFSGLKTSLKYLLRDDPKASSRIADVAASYEFALCRHLTDNLERALDVHPEIHEVHLVGGVSANTRLREMTKKACGERTLRWPRKSEYCTDNGAMIAAAAEFMLHEHPRAADQSFNTEASIALSLS